MNTATTRSRSEAFLWPAVALGGLVSVWALAVVLSKTQIFPSPSQVLRGMGELLQAGRLWRYIGDSLMRVGVGFGLATLLGVPLGLAMGLHRVTAMVLNPVIQVLRPISPLAWIPVAVVLFGVGDTSTIFLILLSSFFPMTMAAMNAVSHVPAIYVRAGRNFGLSGASLLFRVVLPASLPYLINGMRVSLGVAWLVVVAAEMLGVDSGLGYLIMDARNAGKRYDLVVAGMVMIGVIGLALDGLLRGLERARIVRWAHADDS